MKTRKTFVIFLIIALSLALVVGCGGKATNQTDSPAANGESSGNESAPVKIIVGASPVPHAEILEKAKELLAKQNIELEIKEFTDYVVPNIALADGSLDANYFQHVPYLNDFKEQNKLDLTWTVAVHFEPMGLYSKKITGLDELKDGDQIAVPNDTTNEARALLLLQDLGIITLKEGAGLTATKQDVVEYKIKVDIVELEAPQIPRSLEDVAAAVINGNYAIDVGLSPAKDALASEDAGSLAAETYKNVVAIRTGDENRPEIKALGEALNSPEIKSFIEEKYQGAVVPVF